MRSSLRPSSRLACSLRALPGRPGAEPLHFSGEGFSEYFCTQLLLRPPITDLLDTEGAERPTNRLRPIRSAQRSTPRPRASPLDRPAFAASLADLLGWRLGERSKVATNEAEEEGRPAPRPPPTDRPSPGSSSCRPASKSTPPRPACTDFEHGRARGGPDPQSGLSQEGVELPGVDGSPLGDRDQVDSIVEGSEPVTQTRRRPTAFRSSP